MTAELSLRSLLAHPDTGQLTVLSDVDARWEQVVIEVEESDLPDHVESALAILISPAPRETWRLDPLLRRVRDRGFTGVALTGDGVDDRVAALGRRLGLCVLRSERPTQLATACWQLIEARDALTVWAVQRVVRSIEYRATDLGDLLQHVSGSLGQAVALVGPDGVLQGAGDLPSADLLAAVSFDARWLDVVRAGDEFAVSVPVASPSRQGLRVLLHGRDVGAAQERAFGTAVEMLMPMVAARLLIDHVDEVADVSRSAALLMDFVDAKGVDPALDRRLRARRWSTGGYHLGFQTIGRGRVDQLELLRLVNGELAKLDLDTHATTRGAGVAGWLTFAQAPDRSTVTRQLRALRELHRRVSRDFDIATGVGALGDGPSGLRDTLAQAADAARLAADRERAGWFLPVDSLGLEQLILAWTIGDSFTQAAESLLEPLGAGDRELLAAYLDQESSVTRTAETLGLHRNTITGRIQRIQELLGVDLHEPQTRLALQLACRA
ncbi:MAG TPA: helix-turn-helix domain-containing protein [Flexivirga sp.]|uniref:PucR family transcriptional regulator n=1 Tax=Flexivirga sp. TaxID=1962927 RepID=UPI002D1846D9|nr:helix-turn-helix domain-containing protein [Flexivirga sp.]HWC23836.1 helix-turn-helix domain-containing protein [Flexivirga sp.]